MGVIFGGAAIKASFTVTAVSDTPLALPLALQRSRSCPSPNITGLTTASLTINNVQPANGGGYSVVVSDDYGGITSDVNAVRECETRVRPQSHQPDSGARRNRRLQCNLDWLRPGDPSLASGDNEFSEYQRPGRRLCVFPANQRLIIGNQTNSFLVLTNISISTTGRYSISTSNVAGQALSAVVSLTLVADTGR